MIIENQNAAYLPAWAALCRKKAAGLRKDEELSFTDAGLFGGRRDVLERAICVLFVPESLWEHYRLTWGVISFHDSYRTAARACAAMTRVRDLSMARKEWMRLLLSMDRLAGSAAYVSDHNRLLSAPDID
jgi:hypothetical protein